MKDCTPILKNLGELQMDSLKLEEENGTLPKGSFGESDRVSDLGERNLGLESRSSDVGCNSDPMSQYILEPLENIDSFQKEKFEVANNLQAQMERGLKIAGDIEDSQNKLLSLETKNGVLKTEFQTSLQSKNGSKTTMNIINGSGAVGAQTPELNTVKRKSAEQQEMNPAALDMENKRIIRKECLLKCINLQEESFVTSKESESIETESYNYLIEKDKERDQLAYKSDSMEEEMKVQEEVQAWPELVQDLKKKIENPQRALQESQCKSTSLERKHERWVEAEVAHTKKENLKLKKATFSQGH